jgi:hypothetical protein
MAENDQAPSATKRAAVEAATSKTSKVRAGDVVSLAVKTPGGAKPEFRTSGSDRPIYAKRTPGSDTWTAAWVAESAGKHEVTVTAGDADPVTFTVTATSREEN